MARTTAGFYPVKTLNGQPPAMGYFPLIASTAYKEGQPVRLETTGSATRVAAGGTAILGFMAHDVTSASAGTKRAQVWLADGNTLFEGKMLASKAPQSYVGQRVDFNVVSDHNYYLQGTAGGASVLVVDYHPDEALTAHTGCKYWVTGALYNLGVAKASPS
jgi:sulfate adenylyltransferase subunit 1 (EFTu-like GTPase family)